MADTLPLDGSSSKAKSKDLTKGMSLSSKQSTSICVDVQNDLIKNKKHQSVKSEKLNKLSINKESSSPSPSSLSKPASTIDSYQQKRMNQTQCQHQNIQKVNIQNKQAAHQDQHKLMDLQEIEDLRKKRCADRYDSSESSDSGVATLSITDSSATSSEDASNPYSPDNPSNDLLLHLNGPKCSKVPNNNNSNHNKNKQESVSNAPPLAWPWNVNSQIASSTSTSASTSTAIATSELTKVPPPLALPKSCVPSENKTNSSSSRYKRNHSQDTVGVLLNKRNRSSNNNVNSITNNQTSESETDATNNRSNESKRNYIQNNSSCSKSSATITSSININNSNASNIRSQTKITGFFKTQMKALPSLRKDLTNMVVRPTAVPHISQQKEDTMRLLGEESELVNSTVSTKLDTLPLTTLGKKVERKTAKVSPISRKSNAMKKSYTNVLPKKHVNIAPRTNTTSITMPSIGLPSMANTMKTQQTKVMQSVTQQRLHVKLLKRQMEFGGQTDYGVVPLLTTIHLPGGTCTSQTQTQTQTQQHQKSTVGTVQPNQSLQAQKPQTQKPNGAIYQLHPTSVIQIPVAAKETNSQTANNIVVNNGYFINGAFIKLQQMLAPATTGVDQQFRPIKDVQPQTNAVQNLTDQQITMSQKSGFQQQSNTKLAPASTMGQDSAQSITNHNDLTQHFVSNGTSSAQFAQPVLIPTSSGLLLTAALPTMLTPQISNLQPLSQTPTMTTLHQVSEKTSIAVSIEKRPCINMPIQQSTLAVTLTPDNNMQPSFLPNNFAFGVNSAATVAMNQSINLNDKGNRSNLLTSVTLPQPFTQQRIATTTPNTLSLPVTFSLSAPPPLCVQSKEIVQSNHNLNISNPQNSITNSSSAASLLPSNSNVIGSAIPIQIDAEQPEAEKCTQNHDSKLNSKTIEQNLDTFNLTDSISNNISTKQISSVRDIRDSQRNDLNSIPALVNNIQPDKATDKLMVQGNVVTDKQVIPTVVECMQRTSEVVKELDTNLINNASLPESSKSPILSQPKTIRFPANGSRNANDRRTAGCCYWDDCNENCETSSNLLDHLQTTHVNPQTAPFSCLWANCKVHGRESCSRKWLERHVLSHGGSKLFKCIFEKCRMRFGSQLALQKHVNGHINSSENNKDSTVRRSSDPPVPKKLRVNGKRLRYRRQPFSARMFDYFDNGIMEELQHRLLHTVTITNGVSEAITFKGRSIGRRVTATGSVEVLIKWSPNDIISDEWMSASKTSFTKTVQITALTQSERISLMEHLNYLYKFPTNILPSTSNSNDSYSSDEISKKS